MKNKILIIHHGTGLGGGLIALLGLIEELKKENDVSVYCIFKSEAIDYIKKYDVQIITPKNKIFYDIFYKLFSHTEAEYFNLFKFIYKIYKFLIYYINKYIFSRIEYDNISYNYDIVYLNSTFISDWAYYPFKFQQKKTIIHIREPLKDDKSIFYNTIRNSIEKYINQIIAINKDNASRVNIPFKTKVVYDPIVIKRQNKNEKPINLKINRDDNYVLYLGGSARIKGFEQMVGALKYLDPTVKVLFLGGYFNRIDSVITFIKVCLNPYMIRSLILYHKLNRANNAIVVGKTNNVFDYYEISKCTVSCFSKPHGSLPVLESLSMSIPVIVSNIKGMDEFVVDKYNGFFFQNNSSNDLAKKINLLISLDHNDLNLLKNNSKSSFLKLYKTKNMINEVINNL